MKRTNNSINLLIDSLAQEFLVHKTLQNNRMIYMEHTNVTGLIYLHGLLCQNMWEKERLFEDEVGHPVYAATMSPNRFTFLCRVLKFDDPTTRQARFHTDRFAAMRKFYECWNSMCSKAVNPSSYITINECLYGCRNQIGFKTYNPNKPAKYGINLNCLNEVRFPDTFHIEVFAGKPELHKNAEFYLPAPMGSPSGSWRRWASGI